MQSRPAEPAATGVDAHGQAAMLLIESLIHGLVKTSVMPVKTVVEVMEIALDAQAGLVEDAAQPSFSMYKAEEMLSTILEGMRMDLPESH